MTVANTTPTPEQPEAHIGRRFARLREHLQLSQTAAADALGISRSALWQIEKGQTLPSYETLRRARRVFRTSYMYLMEGQEDDDTAAAAPAPAAGAAAAPPQKDWSGETERVVAVTVDTQNNPNIILVPVKAQAGYARARLEPEFLQSYPAFNLPGIQFRNATFRAFEVAGDSMHPTIHNGDILICSYISNWTHLWPGELYVIVLQDDVLVKRIMQTDTSTGRIKLRSDNDFYEPFELGLDEVVEIWKVYAKLTQYLPAPDRRQERFDAMMAYMNRNWPPEAGANAPPGERLQNENHTDR
jgi:transcriptional regulator with XRE-family HTH domain